MEDFPILIKEDDIIKESLWQAFILARETNIECSAIYENPTNPKYNKFKISFEILEKEK